MALSLVTEGLAKVDEYSNAKDLWSAQSAAQAERKNLWSSYDPAQAQLVAEEQAAQERSNGGHGGGKKLEARKEYVDVVVSEVRGGTETVPFSFSVQILKNGGKLPFFFLPLEPCLYSSGWKCSFANRLCLFLFAESQEFPNSSRSCRN